MSRTIDSKSAVDSGWNTIAALPRVVTDSEVSKVTYAVLIANSRSGAGCASLRLPVRTSRNPIGAGLWPKSANRVELGGVAERLGGCLLYTSDAADEEDSVDLGG